MKKIIILSFIALFLIFPKPSFAVDNQNPALFWQKFSLFFTFSPEKKVQKILEFSEVDLAFYESESDGFEKLRIQKRLEKRLINIEKYLDKLDGDFRMFTEDNILKIENSISSEEDNSSFNEIDFIEEELPTLEEVVDKPKNNTVQTSPFVNQQTSIQPNPTPVIIEENNTPVYVEPTREQQIAQQKILSFTEDYNEIQRQMNDINNQAEDLNSEYSANTADLNQRSIDRQQQYLQDLETINTSQGNSITLRNRQVANLNQEYQSDMFELDVEGQQIDLDYQNAYQILSSEFNALNAELQEVALKIQQQQLILD